uniref:mitochondrial import receptor subunit TOM40 homolog isoform X2 n=1 Tax=Styela clava TaxID=7725 RepID=UPI00193A0A3B|nr:mitochondrial import receptor subunit TOM40 homolog isoform X2 [Styela clava]
MGNVMASAAPTPPIAPAPTPIQVTEEKPAEQSSTSQSTNPGTFEELHKLCKDIAMQPFEGIRFMANKGLSSHFQVQHTFHLNNEKSSYRFGSTYVGTKQLSPSEVFPVMVGEMDNDGNLQAQFIHQIAKRMKVKCIAQTQASKLQSLQIGTDITLKDSTISVVGADPDLLNRNGMLIVHYLQAITPNLSLGSEILYQKGAGKQQAIVTFAGRYQTKDWTLAATLGAGGLHTSFFRKANENVQVGVELEASLRTMDSVTSMVYQVDVPKMNLLFKGVLTSQWTIGSSLEKKLLPLPLTLNLTGTYNFEKDKVAVGIGAVLG